MLASQAIMLAVGRLMEARITVRQLLAEEPQSTGVIELASAQMVQRENELGECLKVIDDLCRATGVDQPSCRSCGGSLTPLGRCPDDECERRSVHNLIHGGVR